MYLRNGLVLLVLVSSNEASLLTTALRRYYVGFHATAVKCEVSNMNAISLDTSSLPCACKPSFQPHRGSIGAVGEVVRLLSL
jgi:hypothetical protein